MSGIETVWVIGRFKGDRAKSVKQHADAGLGYFIREEGGRGTVYEVEAAFRWPVVGPLPHHLQECTIDQSMKLDRLRANRK